MKVMSRMNECGRARASPATTPEGTTAQEKPMYTAATRSTLRRPISCQNLMCPCSLISGTLEVVGADRVADLGPAVGDPVIDETGFAEQGLEALRLARWREQWTP